MNLARPYLVIPRLIPQPTWGGTYIAAFKSWKNKFNLSEIAIGQSYELFRDSSVSVSCFNSATEAFQPEIESKKSSVDSLLLQSLIAYDPEAVLGKTYLSRFGKEMTILIKFTQALGNSFQLHRQPIHPYEHWIPKAESWYFFEQGVLTYGIKPGIDITDYKATCIKINTFMKNLSAQVCAGLLSLTDAKEKAKTFIHQRDPWQYVNVHKVPSGTIVDLSQGGIHHSWEADTSLPVGNIVYEVQQNVMDDDCTIRSFDQGKIKNDGTIRTIHIDDYFACIDTDPLRNDIAYATKKPSGNTVFFTPYYSLDEIQINNKKIIPTNGSFSHIFVKHGEVTIASAGEKITVTQGHSAFIPQNAGTYTIVPQKEKAILLKTYIR